MNKALKTILIISIAIFGAGVLFAPSTLAQNNNLVVDFETTPLFNETNFLPGENISRWVRVTNNSGQTQRIATQAINVSDPNRLGDVLNLEIKEGSNRLYNDALSKFFTTGEFFLSNLANGTSTQYDFIVSFYSGTGNPFQGKSLGFDILVGFQGTEGGLLPGAGTGAGGFLPPGLTIQDQSVRVTTTTETSVTIIWTTSYLSTSQVIYAKEGEKHTLDLTDNTGTPPKYGYARTTPEYDVSPKVTDHSVTIYDLTPGTTYYYRTVSHASLAISFEHSFTTLGEKLEEEVEEEVPTGEEIPPEEIVLAPTEQTPKESELPTGQVEKPSEEITEGEEIVTIQEGKTPALVEEKSFREILAEEGLLAAIGILPLNLTSVLVISGVAIASLIILRAIRKRKKTPLKF